MKHNEKMEALCIGKGLHLKPHERWAFLSFVKFPFISSLFFLFHTISSEYVLAVLSLTPVCKRRRRKDLIIVVRSISFDIHRTWHLLYSRYTKYISPSSIINKIMTRKIFAIDIWKRISSVFASLLPAAFWITKFSSLDCCLPMVVDYMYTHVKFVITINLH